MLVIMNESQHVRTPPCIAPSRVTQKIFAVLVDWVHHVVLTLSFKLVSFFYIYQIVNIESKVRMTCNTEHNSFSPFDVCYLASCASLCWKGDGELEAWDNQPFTYNFARPSCSPILTSSAIAERPRDASCQLKSCQLPRNSAETTCTTSPKQIEVMKLDSNFMCWRVTVRQCVINMCTQPWRDRVASIVL